MICQIPDLRSSLQLEEGWRAWWRGEAVEAQVWFDRFALSEGVIPHPPLRTPHLEFSAGWLAWAMGRDEDALKWFRGVAIMPNWDWPGRLGEAVALEGGSRVHEAMERWADLRRKYPWCAVAHERLGAYLDQAGLWESARDSYRAALAQDGSLAGLNERIAKMDLQLTRYEEAYVRYQTVLAMNPDHAASREDMAFILTKIPDYPLRQVALKEVTRERKPTRLVTPFYGKSGPKIRVGISEDLPLVTLMNRGGITIKEMKSGKWVKTVKAGHPISFRAPLKKSLRVVPNDARYPTTVYDVSHGGGQYWSRSQDRSYRGQVELGSGEKGLTVVNRVSLEEYLYGVLAAEMGPSAPFEALKCQAVIARSYLLRRRGTHRGYDVCDDVHCQVYHGVGGEHAQTTKAVDATRLKILWGDGKVASTYFHDSCGGRTRAPDRVWQTSSISDGGVDDGRVPQGASSVGWLGWNVSSNGLACAIRSATTSFIRWQRWYSMDDLREQFRTHLPEGAVLEDLVFDPVSADGVVDVVEARTTVGTVRWVGDTAIRKVFGHLRSRVMTAIPRRVGGRLQGLFLFGRGWGHGVGLCQRGAMGRAQSGWTAEEILTHYFPRLTLKTVPQ